MFRAFSEFSEIDYEDEQQCAEALPDRGNEPDYDPWVKEQEG